MARISGTTALRAALGGVAGGLKGLGAMREEQRLLAQQEEARKRQADLDQLGLLRERFTPVSQTEPTRQAGGDALSRALSSATATLAPGSMMAGRMPSLQAGDTGRIAQGRASTAPQQRVKFGGVEYTRETPESYEANKAQTESMLELEKLGKQQDLIAERNKAANERANRGYFAVLQRAKALPEGVTYEDMQDIDLKPFFDEYKQAQSAEAAMQRANVMAGAQRGMVGSFQTGIDPATGQPTIIGFTRGGEAVSTGVQPAEKDEKGNMMSSLQAMGVTRASSALNLLESNVNLMAKYEQDLLKRKGGISWYQLELAREALKGGRGAAAAESALDSVGGESGRALLRYLRAAKGISGAVREITPRGGSNLMMLMEQTLAAVGPAGVDPESISQVQQFRNDLLNGVREGVQAIRERKALEQIDKGQATPAQAREAYSDRSFLNDWKRSNPKRADESPEEYARKMQAALAARSQSKQ